MVLKVGIWHVHNASGNPRYEGVAGEVWGNGTLDTGWEFFEETLTGQILIEEVPTPSSTIALISLGAMGLIGTWRRKRRAMN